MLLASLAPRRRRLVLVVLAGAVVLLVAVGAVVVRSATHSVTAARQDQQGPVLLVPGYGGSIASLVPLKAALEADGRDVVVVTPPGGGTGDLGAQADHLGDVAHATLDRTGAASVDVVGYSAGGVVARLWVRDGGGAELTRRVLTLGSPQHGTDVAALAAEAAGRCPQACRQLVPDSDVLRSLNAGDETPPGPRFITIASTSDDVVTPTESAALDGALDLTVQDVCPAATTPHGGLPSDPVVLALLESALGTGPPSRPTDVRC